MTIQWTVIAFILYAEILALLILLMPWIRPTWYNFNKIEYLFRWKKFFNSRLVTFLKRNVRYYAYTLLFVLLLLFLDSIRGIQRYKEVENNLDNRRIADSDNVVHMRLFLAERNVFISGFTLLFCLVINRLVELLARSAQLEAGTEAAFKQADKTDNSEPITLSDLSKDKTELLRQIRELESEVEDVQSKSENIQYEYDQICNELNENRQKNKGD